MKNILFLVTRVPFTEDFKYTHSSCNILNTNCSILRMLFVGLRNNAYLKPKRLR